MMPPLPPYAMLRHARAMPRCRRRQPRAMICDAARARYESAARCACDIDDAAVFESAYDARDMLSIMPRVPTVSARRRQKRYAPLLLRVARKCHA